MYELSKSISKEVWNTLKLKYENPEEYKAGEVGITQLVVIRSVLIKFPNLIPIKVKDVSNEESNHGLDFIIEDKLSEKYTFAFQAKVLRGDEYSEIAHISGKKNPEYQVEKVSRTQSKMRSLVGEDKYSAYYTFYNYLDCKSEIFESVKDSENNSFTSLHGVTAAPVEDVYNYLSNIPQYDKKTPRSIPSEYKKVDKISPLTYPWEYIFDDSEIFNRKTLTIPSKGRDTIGFLCLEYKPIPLKFKHISSGQIPNVMSPEDYISYFYGEGKEYLLSEINIPEYVIFGKVDFNI